MAALPIDAHRAAVAAAAGGTLILTAPTGSGKSTRAPLFLKDKVAGRILVLEPRRLSARALAARVAAEEGVALGGAVGYQVRFDSRAGKDTRLVYQTYGVFIQQMLKSPELPGVGAVVLDEFHERTLECDLALAWLKALKARRRPDLTLAVMSATLDAGGLAAYLPEAVRVDAPGRLHPVAVRHLPPATRGGVEEGAVEALKELAREGLDGSVLVFMPGLREIRRTLELMGPLCRAQGLELKSLHGSMELAEQSEVLAAGPRPRVIVATNVAETGLTVPGVTAVVDSGLHRVAAYDAARDLNALRLARISLANAAQRAGRAGRTAPGRCVRLWARTEEAAMAAALAPEMARLELGALALQAASLPEPVTWLTPPPPAAWEAAARSLKDLGALDGAITPLGRALLAYPLPPRLAAVLEGARALGPSDFERAAAMAAVFEASSERRPDRADDLAELAEDLLAGARGSVPWEAVEAYKQLARLGRDLAAGEAGEADALARLWLAAFPGRLGAAEGAGRFYRLADGHGAVLAGTGPAPSLLLALDLRRREGGAQARQSAITLYLPLSLATVERAYPGRAAWREVSEFDARAGRVVKEQRYELGGLVLARREAAPAKADRKAAADIWAEKYASGELRHPGFDAKVEQLVARVRLARSLYPDLGFPALDADDWRLVYGEVCAGKNTAEAIGRVELAPHLLAYLGRPLADFLEKVLPTAKRLPSGKTGRFAYAEGRPAELSARLGDFLGMKGTLALCEGRLPVLFDILAPNYRTVQKTPDLSSFWANTYPEVKKELKRRYPKHPWP